MSDYIANNWLEIAGTIVGFIYLWQEVKASIWLWLTGIVMPAIYTVVFFENGLYADFAIQVYYIGAALYGFLLWEFGKKNKYGDELRIVHTTERQALWLCATTAVLFVPIYWILTTFTDSTVSFWDSVTTAMSFVALWMLAKKHVEQWIAWIIIDIISAILYFYKGIYFTSILYGVYTVVAFYGYRKWDLMEKNQDNDNV